MGKKVKTQSALVRWIGQDLQIEEKMDIVSSDAVAVPIKASQKSAIQQPSKKPQRSAQAQAKTMSRKIVK